jgi:hypothetical protein
MNWRKLTWTGFGPPLEEATLRDVERQLGVRFPDDFRACIATCHGGTPKPNGFDVAGESDGFGTGLGALMRFDRGASGGILRSISAFAINGDRPDGVIPFGETGDGDFICYYYNPERPGAPPTVVYWERTRYPTQEFMFLAHSFSEFLDLLHEDHELPRAKNE